MAGSWQVGSILAQLGIDTKAFQAGLKTAQAQAKTAGSAIGKAFEGIQGGISKATSAVMSLQGLMVAFASYRFGSMVAEAESLEGAFRNLQRSVGELADVTLAKMRTATRGTVSDLELMRATNNLVLLGVGKSSDEWSALADAGRRLGKAVGRDALSGMEDLAIGIGRQSRMILDNLGLIVQVEKANQTYAASIGKTVEQLNDADKRTAFYTATMEAVRLKLLDLGEDVPSLGDKFGVLRAQMANAAVSIGMAFVPAIARAAEAIGKFIESGQGKLKAISAYIRGFIDLFISSIGELAKSVMSGQSTITGAVYRVLATVFNLAMDMFSSFGNWVIAFVVNLVQRVGVRLALEIVRLIQKTMEVIPKLVGAAVKKAGTWILPDSFSKQLETEIAVMFTDVEKKTSPKIDAILTTGWQAAMEKALNSITAGLPADFGKELKDKFKKLQDEFNARGGDSVSPAMDLLSGTRKTRPDTSGMADREAATQALIIWDDLENTISNIVDLQAAWVYLTESGSDPKALKQVDDVLKQLVEKATTLNKTLYEVLRPKTIGLSPEEFAPLLQGFKDMTKGFETDAAMTGLSKWDAALKSLNTTYATAVERVKDNVDQVKLLTEEYNRGRDAITSGAGSEAIIAAQTRFVETQASIVDTTRSLNTALDTANMTDYQKGVSAAEAAIAKLKNTVGATPEQLQRLQEDLYLLKGALQETADAALLEIRVKEWGTLTKDLSNSVMNGIADGFARGEKASKVWANIASDIWKNAMNKAINSLSDSIGTELSDIFGNAGAAGGMAGMANGLIAIGGAIYSNLNAKKTTTVDDFSEAINSSEAVRGIVAGPTNVAIATVGDALKDALRITEMLLERIARAVEGSWSAGGGTGRGMANSTFPLTGSTT